MATIDWLWILHPALIVTIAYPLLGVVLNLARRTRQRRLEQSHYRGGAGLTGLLLFSLAARPEIQRSLRWRRLHLGANALAALLFLAQAISGSRDLLEIPLSWQKPAIQACDFAAQVCHAPPPPAS